MAGQGHFWKQRGGCYGSWSLIFSFKNIESRVCCSLTLFQIPNYAENLRLSELLWSTHVHVRRGSLLILCMRAKSLCFVCAAMMNGVPFGQPVQIDMTNLNAYQVLPAHLRSKTHLRTFAPKHTF